MANSIGARAGGAELIRVAGGAVGFVLLANVLSLEMMSLYSALVAIVMIIGPVLLLGLPLAVTRAAASDEQWDFRRLFLWTTIFVAVVVGLGCVVVGLVAGHTVLALGPLIAVVVSESVCASSGALLLSYGSGTRRSGPVVWSALVSSLPRLTGAIAALFTAGSPEGRIQLFALMSVGTSALISLLASRSLDRRAAWGLFEVMRTLWRSRMVTYVLSSTLSRLNDDLDKILLQSLTSGGALALYSVPYRIAFYGMVPARAVLTDSMRMIHGQGGLTLRLLLRRWAVAGLLAGACGVLLVLLWPAVVGILLPEEYLASHAIVALLSIAVVFRSLQYFLGEHLFARSRGIQRTLAQAAGVLVGAVATVLLVSRMGVLGAAVSTVLAEIVVVLALLVACFWPKGRL